MRFYTTTTEQPTHPFSSNRCHVYSPSFLQRMRFYTTTTEQPTYRYSTNLCHVYSPSFLQRMRFYTTTEQPTRMTAHLTHVNATDGKATMVPVGDKPITTRRATARAIVQVGPQLTQLIKENDMKKGDVLSVAELAGIMAAKRTAELIPLCHNIPLSNIKVTAHLDEVQKAVVLQGLAQCEGKTGVEMEALTAVTVAALTVYDMCKAVSHDIRITEVTLVSKSGGTNGDYKEPEKFVVRDYEKAPIPVGKEQVFVGPV